MIDSSTEIALRHSENGVDEILFSERVLAGARFIESAFWPCDLERYPGDGEILFRRRWPSGETVLAELALGGVAIIALGAGEANVRVGSPSAEATAGMLAALRALIPATSFTGDRRPVAFWSDHPMGPRRITRSIMVPSWEEIAPNYPLDIAHELARLVDFRPSAAGQLLLWRGEPGTGKTWGLRGLIREWSSWARFHYVTDPDCLFGHNASYMLSVLLDDEAVATPSEIHGSEEESLWKVLLLEDAGEMLSRDARERSGQGLSRLLNLVDGLIGQGLRVFVLVTTNEELGALHPAITRPGRCAVNLEFRALSQEEAQAWLAERSEGLTAKGATTIADLYAMISGQVVAPERLIGFVGSRE